MFNNEEIGQVEEAGAERGKSPAQTPVIAIVIAVTVGSLLYRVIQGRQLGHTAAMFIGLPAVLAILLALTPKTKSATGAILKGITLMLLIVAPLLGEGWICILIASPLFYLVGVVVGLLADRARRKQNAKLSCAVLVLLLPLSLEGVVPALTLPRLQTVEVTRIVDAPADAVERALGVSARVETPLPAWIRIFPAPLQAWGSGLNVGDTRTIMFAGAEGHAPGDLRVVVTARASGFVRTEAVSDGSKLTQWASWRSSDVMWRSLEDGKTEVTWRITFERRLDPAWYFVPLERGVVHEAAVYMIEANATPAGGH